MDSTSVSLLQRLKQPDAQEAWARFVHLYTPLFFYWACRLGLQESDAADLVQEVFMTLVPSSRNSLRASHKPRQTEATCGYADAFRTI
jgi:DNA-directed RNA polymerase specialized sigma24 family protein